MIARVEPLTLTRAVRGPFDYRLGRDCEGVRVGSLLRVPFGAQRPLGVVVALAERSDVASERLLEPLAVLPSALPEDLVALATWMAREYCSTVSRALGLLLPPGAANGVTTKRVVVAELSPAGRDALGDGTRLTPGQRAALERLQREGRVRAPDLGRDMARRLERRGLVSLGSQTVLRRPARHDIGAASALHRPVLTADQQRALTPILDALKSGKGRFLLQGVTGSGKTEVYLQAVEATLAAGRTAIVLVPEIALTPQALNRFEARFGEVVAVLHSGLSAGARVDEWRRLTDGEARVCVGPRSAVFAPLSNIGLIVVDEEHEGSYKNEGDPRYDARLVAQRRAAEHRAVLVAGSATPRPESVHSLPRLRLSTRVDGRPLPPVEVLDMRGHHHPLHPESRLALADVRHHGRKAIILLNRRGWSNFLSCRACGRVWMCPNCEVALVLHRSARLVACHHCGHRERVPHRCPACASVAVARHGAGTERIEHELRESLGDAAFPVFRLDADSSGLGRRAEILERFQAAPAGLLVGTQMVAKGHDFPDVSLGVVLDADQTLRFPDFRAEERTFALVTQLAGRAGRGTHPPATHPPATHPPATHPPATHPPATHPPATHPPATHPPATHPPGTDSPGRVLVQTLAPDARAILLAARHDTDGFLEGELARRQALGYPPFTSLIRVVCSAVQAGDAVRAATALRERIDPPDAIVLGPAALFALRGRARSQLVIKARDRAAAIAAVGNAVDQLARSRASKDVNISVDVDPQ